RIAKWLKQEGDPVSVGEPLVELETDKVDVEVSAPQSGVLASIVHKDGADVKIGDVLGTIEEGRRKKAEGKGDGRKKEKEKEEGRTKAEPVAATPSARRLARQEDIDLASVKPEGPRVRPDDLRQSAAAKAQPVAAPSTPARPAAPTVPTGATAPRSEERVRMSKRRATIAKRLVEAQATAAMLTTFNEVDMTAVQQIRERRKAAFKDRYGVSLGLTSFFVKATIAALRDFPRLNAEIQGDEMVLKHYYDIGIAVGAEEGLVVPVLRDADRLSYAEIEHSVRDFASRAKDGSLTLEDLRGGTFTITNGGVFGSLMSTPILNPPQVGILGLHAIKDRPAGVDGRIELRPMMYTALTYDHRI